MEGHLTTGSVFDDMGRSPEEAANLKVRARLMDRLTQYVEEKGLTQEEAAAHFGVVQPRVSLLVSGRISKFTIDALLNMCVHAGIEVNVTFGGAYAS